jgi:nucleoside-diphosphate-sugar epimerase
LANLAGAVCEAAWRLLRLKSEPPITRFSAQSLGAAHWYDISSAKRDLDYQPKVSIAEGLLELERSQDAGAA